jgi:hypothetical protein
MEILSILNPQILNLKDKFANEKKTVDTNSYLHN